MGKLLVLSEIHCDKFLASRGIYPDEFYTDFMLFKNRSSTFDDVDVIVLFAGSCSFSKRHVLDIVKVLRQRADDEDDKGIRSLTVLADVFLPKVSRYYKFQGTLENISEYNGWKLIEKHSNILDSIPRGTKGGNQVFYLTSNDKGDVSGLREEYKNIFSADEPLRDLIKKPDFSRISEI